MTERDTDRYRQQQGKRAKRSRAEVQVAGAGWLSGSARLAGPPTGIGLVEIRPTPLLEQQNDKKKKESQKRDTETPVFLLHPSVRTTPYEQYTLLLESDKQ